MSQRERYERGGVGRWYWDYRDRAILSMIRGGSTLDVGCGDGITTAKIPGAVGMDLDRGDVRGSVYDLPFRAESFDNVLFSEVVEHLDMPFHAVSEIKRVLKRGGRVVMVFPNDRTFKAAWAVCGMWGEIGRDRGHRKQWTPTTAAELLEYYGLKIRESMSIPFGAWPCSLHHIMVGERC